MMTMLFWLGSVEVWSAEPEAAQPEAEAQAKIQIAPPSILAIDAKVPVEVFVGGHPVGELYYPAKVQFEIEGSGQSVVRLYTNGQPTDVPVELLPGNTVRILVGRNGVTVESEATPLPEDTAGPFPIELRFVGSGAATVRLDKQRLAISPDRPLAVEIARGKHALSVRSEDGTVIWASGELVVDGPLIVQIAEGRMPEISGAGRFVAGS